MQARKAGNGPERAVARAAGPLPQGELSAVDARELQQLKTTIQRELGIESHSYKEPCLRRRLAVRMRARGTHTFADYARLLEEDPSEAERLLDAITINVSKFFRNAEIWELLRNRVVPQLFRIQAPRIRIWSAGCASGEEPYTMAMVLLRYAEEHRLLTKLRRFDILGTDIDPGVLQLAQRAEYGAFAFSEIAPDVRARFFEDGNKLRPEIKRMVRFEQLDLMTEPLPTDVHLIFCRNVIIYFERSVQERLFAQFHASLLPEGYLVLGKVETIFGTAARLFRPIASRERIFCRA
jgi:chemotaxis protein methyltransferase CheR